MIGYSVGRVITPAAAIGTSTEVVMLDDCTATVATRPTSMATSPLPPPSTRLSRTSSDPATRAFMLRVMNASATKIAISPPASSTSASAVPPRPSPSSPPVSASTGFSTAAFTGLSKSAPPPPATRPASQWAVRSRMPVSSSSGSSTATVSRLKTSWTVAAATARLNSTGRRMLPTDASVLVTLVPMLAPITIGTAAPTLSTPEATRPTIVDVVTDEDWTSTVASTPTNRPAIGELTRVNSASWTSLPRAAMPSDSSPTPARKTYSSRSTSSPRAQPGRPDRVRSAASAGPDVSGCSTAPSPRSSVVSGGA